ncbi:hypothetical protein HHI36_015675 [Cryptolaemus montrouzieri]|uniref:Uncharacterized protein n=1 Tax=Cryptolaemus montrouzieri TaxID=559131 RepID=A0ABD2N6A6_9CUCU
MFPQLKNVIRALSLRDSQRTKEDFLNISRTYPPYEDLCNIVGISVLLEESSQRNSQRTVEDFLNIPLTHPPYEHVYNLVEISLYHTILNISVTLPPCEDQYNIVRIFLCFLKSLAR